MTDGSGGQSVWAQLLRAGRRERVTGSRLMSGAAVGGAGVRQRPLAGGRRAPGGPFPAEPAAVAAP